MFPRVAVAGAVVALLAGCAAGPLSPTSPQAPLPVVAAENFWGSLAAQLGGDRVRVTTIISRPDADPHSYEPTAADARSIAAARMVLYNGVGYDPWAAQLAAVSPRAGRVSLDVGSLAGVRAGANPHLWYSPTDVHRVIDQITADFQHLAPGDAGFFAQRHDSFLSEDLGTYDALVAGIRARFGGTAIGGSESIIDPLAAALGLDVVTPPSFLRAISEGGEPTASDLSTIHDQIRQHRIRVYVFNSQNSTPDVEAQVTLARQAGIPVVAITETLTPASATFESWQMGQLQALETALSGRAHT